MERFKLTSFLTQPTDAFHFAKVNYSARKELSMHSHDYFEVFWIENGSGIHYINGEKEILEKGYLVMVRPDDTHTFSASPADIKGLTITNLAIKEETVHFFKYRYFIDSTKFFWSKDQMPFKIKLFPEDLIFLSLEAEKNLLASNDNLTLDYVLNLIFRIARKYVNHAPVKEELPYWLKIAIDKFNSVEYLYSGAEGFAKICNRSIDHINRVLKSSMNLTLTEMINKIKMEYAANQLIMTNSPVKNISHQCGYKNLGHFYKVFNEKYNTTPIKFRKINHKII